MTTSIVMVRIVAAEAVEAIAITKDAGLVAVTWNTVAMISTLEGSGRETSTSMMQAVAAKMAEAATTARLAVAVRTVTAEDVVIWVACDVLATSDVQLMALMTTLTLVVTAQVTAIVVPVMAT
jgi:hypothetical protein